MKRLFFFCSWRTKLDTNQSLLANTFTHIHTFKADVKCS